MTAFSVLDLCPIVQGGTAADALQRARQLAQLCEQLGYRRYWLAEHHNMRGIASAATALAISHVAAGTQTIRVGAGGIMLPNHAPLVVAEQFGTLESLYPGRIDLGLGRAPGTDQLTMQALRRNLDADVDQFPRDVVEILGYFNNDAGAVQAVPGAGLRIPVWILGSSLFGAQLAAALGLPYAFASHFAPAQLDEALALYRDRFRPSDTLAEPYVMAGFGVYAAATDREAQALASSMQQTFVALRRGNPGPLPPPLPDYGSSLPLADQHLLKGVMQCSAIGSPGPVAEQLQHFLDRTGVDEVIITSQIYDHQARCESYRILAELMNL